MSSHTGPNKREAGRSKAGEGTVDGPVGWSDLGGLQGGGEQTGASRVTSDAPGEGSPGKEPGMGKSREALAGGKKELASSSLLAPPLGPTVHFGPEGGC